MNNVDIDNQKSRKSSHMKNHHSTEGEVRIPVSASAPVPLGGMTTVPRIKRVPQRRLPSSFREHEQKVPSSESTLVSLRQPRATRGRIMQHSEAVINECQKKSRLRIPTIEHVIKQPISFQHTARRVRNSRFLHQH
jgi:hypothetical protein